MDGYEKRGKFWSKRYREIDQLTGKELHKRFSKDEKGNKFETLKACKEAFQRFSVLSKNKNTSQTDVKIVYFKDLYEKFKDRQRLALRPTSYISYEYIYNSHILPTFGELKLTNITPLVIHEWQLSIDHFSYKYKAKIRECLGKVLKFGEKYFKTPNNFGLVDGFSKSKDKKKEMSIWTPEQFKQFIEHADNFQDKVIFTFLYMMGVRKGEMCALQWQDINLTNKTCKITKTITRTFEGFEVGENTKNSKHRVLAIPHTLFEQLKQLYNIARNRPNFSNTHFLFGDSTFLSFTTLSRKFEQIFEKAKKEHPELEKIRIHDFRHSHVSLLINKANSTMSLSAMLYSIAERLGDSVEQVLKTYGHLFPNTQRDLVATLNDF
jgi:integrase